MTLEFRSIRHAYGAARVLDGVDLIARAGDVTCLLGPSGCGKTTLLRLAAGLVPVQEGEIALDGALLAGPGRHPPPEKRPMGLVFQEGALFPHLTVEGNVGFALARGAERNARVAALLERVGLSGYSARYPHTLSGGQQQRVALARALAPAPRVLLLDEPFASIDVTLRRRLREEMRPVLKNSGAVSILVTHDPDDALDMADAIAVMEKGRIVQAGAPAELYDRPATPAVATMIGEARAVAAEVGEGGAATPFGVWPRSSLVDQRVEGPLTLMVRPAALGVEPGDECQVTDVRVRGGVLRVTVAARSGETLVADLPRDAGVSVGERVKITPAPESVLTFPATS